MREGAGSIAVVALGLHGADGSVAWHRPCDLHWEMEPMGGGAPTASLRLLGTGEGNNFRREAEGVEVGDIAAGMQSGSLGEGDAKALARIAARQLGDVDEIVLEGEHVP